MKALPKLSESGKSFNRSAALTPIPAGRRSFAEQRRAVEEFLNSRDGELDSPGLPHVPAPRASSSSGVNEDALEERKRHLRAQREKSSRQSAPLVKSVSSSIKRLVANYDGIETPIDRIILFIVS